MADRLYRTIVADPPWRVNRSNGWGKGATSSSTTLMPYPLMTVSEIEAMPISKMAAPTSHLYLWTVNLHVPHAYRVCRAWGFAPSALLTWVKQPRGIGPGGHFASTTEFVLFARRGTEGGSPANRVRTSWFEWPRGAHSEKPAAFFDMVEQVSPGPYLELFARRQRLGWDTWGNESLEHVRLEAGRE